MNQLKFSVSVLFLLLSTFAQAQTTKEEFLSDVNHASGIYQIYKYVPTPATPAPKGYEPFYISHYGRHGSRWIHTPETYAYPLNVLNEAHKAGKLSALGESLYERVSLAAKDAEGRYGDLTPLGVREHREIAERMFRSFPEVFSTKKGRKCYIYSRSTVVPRCILSMAANNERLKELNPEIEITRDAAARFTYLNNSYANVKRDSVYAIRDNFIKKHLDTERFINSLFTDKAYVKDHVSDPVTFIRNIHLISGDLPDVDHLKISMADLFTSDDHFTLWQALNMSSYYNVGPSAVNGKVAMDSSKLLLREILECADNAVKTGNRSADLRFGHDTYIIPLLALLDIKGMNNRESVPENIYAVWSDFKVSPMGANLQIIFYRNGKTGDVVVKLLHCEKEVEIPVKTDIAPYYHWKDFKAYYQSVLR
ncbi:MAG: hypothetical protein A2X18_06465 [Bacteroidetes bacterium GWF2_40_14]|nr:MAG: hypothetical protein A2X18_06465 [Bacteroidetes bacterium GWF2_40_14]